MPRPMKWMPNGYKSIKVKVDINTHQQYKNILKKKKTTAQEDLSNKIKQEINDKENNK